MAVQDLWVSRKTGQPTARYGRGLRYRVVVTGHETKSFRTKRPAEIYEAKLLAEGPVAPQSTATVGDMLDDWLAGKRGLTSTGYRDAQGDVRHVRQRRWTVGWHEHLDDAIADARERIENPEPVTPLVGGGEGHGSCVSVEVQRERWAAGLDPRTGLPRGRLEDSST